MEADLNATESPDRAAPPDAADTGGARPRLGWLLPTIAIGAAISVAAYLLLSERFDPVEVENQRTVADLRKAIVRVGAGVDEAQLFPVKCAACHQAGEGLPGVFAPLEGSDWVFADEPVVRDIVLRSANGEITLLGRAFVRAMPTFQGFGTTGLAALSSHLRATWANKGVSAGDALLAKVDAARAPAGWSSDREDVANLAGRAP